MTMTAISTDRERPAWAPDLTVSGDPFALSRRIQEDSAATGGRDYHYETAGENQYHIWRDPREQRARELTLSLDG